MARKLFGTDGVRGAVGDLLTADLGRALGRAAAAHAEAERPRVLIIRDTRESGEMLERALAEGVCAAGGEVLLGGVLPTPAAPLLIRRYDLDLAAVVSASHNPYGDNGIKFFAADGYKLSDETELEIERELEQWGDVAADGAGVVRELRGADEDYLRELGERFAGLDLSGLDVLLDCANGATYAVAPEIFRRLGANVTAINAEPDGRNINAGCGSTHVELIAERIRADGHGVGFAFDGDGDRVLAVDGAGRVVDGDELIALAALHLRAAGKLEGGGAVVTVMSNYGFHVAMRDAGVDVAVTQVGDRYVLAELRARGWRIGGEQSGHIIDMAFNHTGDGIGERAARARGARRRRPGRASRDGTIAPTPGQRHRQRPHGTGRRRGGQERRRRRRSGARRPRPRPRPRQRHRAPRARDGRGAERRGGGARLRRPRRDRRARARLGPPKGTDTLAGVCGIVGYVGARSVQDVLLDGLSRLEYRGYDSAGISVLAGGNIDAVRTVGKVDALREKLSARDAAGTVAVAERPATTGIGHTRWATHGRVSEENAHPHYDGEDRVHVVVNGIVENYIELRDELTAAGCPFTSETDAEVIAHLIARLNDGDLVTAVRTAYSRLDGHFAFVAMSADEPELLVGARRECPLVVGLGDEENVIASDVPAFLAYTRRVLYIEDGEIVALRRDGVELTKADGTPVDRAAVTVDWDAETAEKGGYETFMLKEIYEQADALSDAIADRTVLGDRVVLGEEGAFDEALLEGVERVVIVACGTSYHAGLVGRYAIEGWARIPVEVDIASEYRYRDPIVGPGDLVLGITQSGETADTLAAMRLAAERGARVVAVTNVMGSQATREAAGVLFTRAGMEIGVAATKTFLCQVAVMYLLALRLAQGRAALSPERRHGTRRRTEAPSPRGPRVAAGRRGRG